MRLSFHAALASLLTFSCAGAVPSTHYTVVFPDSNTYHRHVVYKSFEAWTEATNGAITFDYTDHDEPDNMPPPWTIRVRLVTQEQLEAMTPAGYKYGVLGRTYWDVHMDNATIYLGPAGVVSNQIVEHEIGHALQLEHDIPGTIMCENSGCASTRVTCRDAKNVLQLRMLSIDCDK